MILAEIAQAATRPPAAMPTVLTFATMGFAALAYSVGVWAERIGGKLRPWHLVVFWLGLAADTWGTVQMFNLLGYWRLSTHGVLGTLGLAVMAGYVIYATVVVIRNDPKGYSLFHKLSLWIWIMWMVIFFMGAQIGMSRRAAHKKAQQQPPAACLQVEFRG